MANRQTVTVLFTDIVGSTELTTGPTGFGLFDRTAMAGQHETGHLLASPP
jgi:hypothetical protein